MSAIKFSLKPVKEKPPGKSGYKSKWDPPLEAFLMSGEKWSYIEVDGYSEYDVKDRLQGRIVSHALTEVVEVYRSRSAMVKLDKVVLSRLDEGEARGLE